MPLNKCIMKELRDRAAEGGIRSADLWELLGVSRPHYYYLMREGVPEKNIPRIRGVISAIEKAIKNNSLPFDTKSRRLARYRELGIELNYRNKE